MQVSLEKCIGCGFCLRDCPTQAIKIKKKKTIIDDLQCTDCGACARVCEQDALVPETLRPEEAVECDSCPVRCWIHPGYYGACHRYQNENGELVRTMQLHSFEDVREIVGPEPAEIIRKPIITGIGAGTTYPDCKPAPYIIGENRNGVDVVTVVTEVPLSYSSVIVKVDTDIAIGKQGDSVFVGKREVGMVETEQYGSKMLHIGGVNQLTGKNGLLVARTITDIANRKPVKLKIKTRRLSVRVGHPPVIDNNEAAKMRVGCGSATLGIFAPLLKEAADDVIILDAHITGLMSQHVAGRFAGAKPTGVSLEFKQSTPGRYFGDHGNGWGGTSITNPTDIIKKIDMKIAWKGMTIFITETTGQNSIMLKVDENGSLCEILLNENAKAALDAISGACEPSRVSAVYTGGAGGSARAGVVRYPVRLTRAVHECKASLTVGGSPTFVLPGGGISFMVDVERVKPGSFYWTPTPATICPVEYTMKLKDYEKMGGHVEAMKPFSAKNPVRDSEK